MYYLVPGTMGFVCKSFETRNQAERPPTSRVGCNGSSKGPVGRREVRRGAQGTGLKFARRCILGRAAVHRSKAEGPKGNARKRAGREQDAERRRRAHAQLLSPSPPPSLTLSRPFYIMRHVVPRRRRGYTDDGENKCAMKRRMRETGEYDVTCNFDERLNILVPPPPHPFGVDSRS